MKNEKPILFSSEMVRAILGGRKTMTRRVMKPQPDSIRHSALVKNGYETNHGYEIKCPYGQVGNHLWVRETWAQDDVTPEDIYYRARYDDKEAKEMFNDVGLKWRPSIFMPRWASRITLEITNIKVERLQDITIRDAVKEGMEDVVAVLSFARLWDSINGKEYPWDSNPWVWVIEFKVIKRG